MKDLLTVLKGESRKKVSAREFTIMTIIASVLLISTVLLGILYTHARHTARSTYAQASDTELAAHVRALASAPEETPTIATVADPEKLKDQEFFKQAEKGDKVLIYAQAKKAVLYRPSTDIIIAAGPIE